ncbi:MAG TPA: hypothetical protein VIK32_14370 [Candidatus Limnocylindrales bacterium]
MVGRRAFRALGVSLAALPFMLLETSAVMAAPSQCSASVSPPAGAAGIAFTFSGTGFKPTEITLHKNDTEAGVHELSVTSDPWQVSVRSRPGDEGSWSAELSSDQCSAVVEFKVTLANTDVVSDAQPTSGSGSTPIGLALFVLAGGIGGGLALGRRVNDRATDNRLL